MVGVPSFEFRNYGNEVWRVVEAQHVVSTLKIVDSGDEQEILEAILDGTKPPFPAECSGYSYLIATPFRYGALYPHGSRFRRAGYTPGVLYASETDETAIAESAFYRILFFTESPDTPFPDNPSEFTAFSINVQTRRLVDLTAAPLSKKRKLWTDPVNYEPCQALEEDARAAGAEAIRYESVRDPKRRCNLAGLTCSAVASREPLAQRTWRLHFGETGATATREFPRLRLSFTPDGFADPRLAGARWR